MTKKVIEALSKHFFHLLKLGSYYAYLSEIADLNGVLGFAKYIKYLSDDKLGVHKDKLKEFFAINGVPIDIKQKGNDLVYEEFKDQDYLKNAKKISDILLKLEEDDKVRVYEIADLLHAEKDYASYDFFKWYVSDALKDFSEVSLINDCFKVSNDLLLIDKQIRHINKHKDDEY